MRVFKIALCTILTVLLLSVPVSAIQYTPDFSLASQSVYIVSLDNGNTIYSQNADTRIAPASISNIMTAVLALESELDLDNEYGVMRTYMENELYLSEARLAGIVRGEEISLHKLLYAMMLQSGADAAMMIADAVAGSQEDFVTMMNDKAAQLGAANTHFTNVHGLFEEGNYTTAEDVAIITEYALGIPGFLEICDTVSYQSGTTNKHDNLYWTTSNPLITTASRYHSYYAKGIKSGYTSEGGRYTVTEAQKDGVSYLIVLMSAPAYDSSGNQIEENLSAKDAVNIIDWVYSKLKVKTLVEKDKNITEVPLRLSREQDYIRLMCGETFTALLPVEIDTENIQLVCNLPESVDAPVQRGDKVGTVQLIMGGEILGEIDLVSADTVQANKLLIVIDKLGNIVSSIYFKFIIALLVLLIILYVFLVISKNRKNRKRMAYRRRRR